ncbi:MAG TPA: DUF3313 family protein [Burkholderiales bacterium]|nr:DUF3313 family protein [Burkholderiales bacterium]
MRLFTRGRIGVGFYGPRTMRLSGLLVVCLALAASGCAGPGAPTADGLEPLATTKVDAFYVRPNSNIGSYHQVFIDPVPVQFRSDFINQRHGLNYLLAEPMYRPFQDPEAVAKDMSSLMQAGLYDAFKAANYEVVGAPGPGVLRVSAKINELFINSPDRLSSTVYTAANRDTGQATLFLEASDATSGNVLARVEHRVIVREVSRLNLSSDSGNRFWFENAFRRWATNVVTELGSSRRTQVSLTN